MRNIKSDTISTPPKAVIFDLDGTLYDYETTHKKALDSAISSLARELRQNPTEVRQAYDESRAAVKKRLGKTASSHSRLIYFKGAIEQLLLQTEPELTLDVELQYWQVFLKSMQPYPGVADFLVFLKSLGIKTAVLTNMQTSIQLKKLMALGFDRFFDFVITSEEIGYEKPDTRPFEAVLSKLKKASRDTWFFGDDLDADVLGATSVGIKTFYIGKQTPAGLNNDIGVVTFDCYTKLIKQLEAVQWGSNTKFNNPDALQA